MPQIAANGITLEYEDNGAPAAPPLLLIMGLGAQLTLWPMELVEALAERGFRVIRFDNRDIGLSHKLEGAKAPGMVRHILAKRLGLNPRVPYTLADMAADAAGLLDALGIARAHIVGASMGGMIAQHIAFSHPEKVASLTSIMSTSGNPRLPQARREALKVLTKRPASLEEAVLVEHGVRIGRTIGSPGFPADERRLRAATAANVRRSVYPQGMPRQLAAIIDDGDRRARLARVQAPTLVIHGEADPLVPVEGGRDTAAHIPGAKLKTIPGMGHDLPLELVDEIADAIAGHARAAEAIP
ncbi:alpha/beta fold hydrolase [Qipengyuania sediminis]|uniref:alpha/beta fold hydrolase n=1 Tax=Qipengyuania sediminis TaxID=1532023 RepID=UPI0010597819|nr:alpha/beta fold hydrolase [Qipengyuania sediminis]